MEASSSTTRFAPASSCVTDIYDLVDTLDGIYVQNGSSGPYRYYHLGPSTSDSNCFPTDWSPSSGAYMSTNQCPLGYHVACSLVNVPETTGTCCPENYSCQTESINWKYQTTDICVSTFHYGETLVFTTSTPGQGWQTSTTSVDWGAVNAYGIDIRWQTSSSPSIITPTSSTTSIVTMISATPKSLSAGAGIGIGIGAAVAVVLLLVGAWLLWRRRRKGKGEKATAHETLPLEDHVHPADRVSAYTGSDRSASARPRQWATYNNAEWSEMQHISPPLPPPVELGPGHERGGII
ncbi:hypothetical protein F5Y11DRAFT_212556 [Daldinia sp. FL1419]|nr:hypothetical protein F5Y11DRAFT_212556 [Daldinia sp. FL1419]